MMSFLVSMKRNATRKLTLMCSVLLYIKIHACPPLLAMGGVVFTSNAPLGQIKE